MFGLGAATSATYLSTHNRELRDATTTLLDETVPAFASLCTDRWSNDATVPGGKCP